MIQCHQILPHGLSLTSLSQAIHSGESVPAWIDLVNPSDEVVAELERFLKIDILTPAEIARSGPISRLYRTDDNVFAIITAVAHADDAFPNRTAVTFVLTNKHLITLRYEDLAAFKSFYAHHSKRSDLAATKEGVFFGLLDEIIDRLSDLLERSSGQLDQLSRMAFAKRGSLDSHLTEIGRVGDLTSKIRESLLSMQRMLVFLNQDSIDLSSSARDSAAHNVSVLLDQAAYLLNQINFVLNASLGLISVEQNKTIKIFSVVAVIFLPPTLIASIYGMNFQYMPEISMRGGYPLALGAMVLSAVLPYFIFKRMRWL